MRELFTGNHVILAAPREGDAEASARWYTLSEFLRSVDTDVAFPRTAEELEQFSQRTPTAFPFSIRLAATDELIGFISLHSIEWNNQCGALSLGIGEARHRGRGYAAEALRLVLQYAFCELNLYRVGLDYIDYNAGARRLYEGLGFVEEGRRRAMVYRDGARHDLVLMGLLRPDWEAREGAKA